MCANSIFTIKNTNYFIYGGYGGSTFSIIRTNIKGHVDIIDYYVRSKLITDLEKETRKTLVFLSKKRRYTNLEETRDFGVFKKELEQYTKEELIEGFYDMLENFEEY